MLTNGPRHPAVLSRLICVGGGGIACGPHHAIQVALRRWPVLTWCRTAVARRVGLDPAAGALATARTGPGGRGIRHSTSAISKSVRGVQL